MNVAHELRTSARLQTIPTYIFAEIGRRARALAAEGTDVVRLDIGSPDLTPAPEVIETLIKAVKRPDSHGYPSFYGMPDFRRAVADYYVRRFDVALDPEMEVLGLIGSKEGIYHVATAFVDPDNVVLVPDPSYPAYRVSATLAGGEVYPLPLLRENGFLPDFAAVPHDILTRARVLWLNYPNNPTGAVAGMDFLNEAVAFARTYHLLLAYDNPYSEITWDGTEGCSVLQVKGARDVAIEFNSLSKTANMAGWRIGMAVGNAQAITALARVKTNADTGAFKPLQEAASVALALPASWIEARNAVYQRRREVVTQALDRMRLWYTSYTATFYVWMALPPRYTNAAAFTMKLLEQTGVSLAPGSAFGAHGEGYARISLVQPEERLAEAMERVERWFINQAMGTQGTVGFGQETSPSAAAVGRIGNPTS
jgi:LL-diaminopimelate aminotransferase